VALPTASRAFSRTVFLAALAAGRVELRQTGQDWRERGAVKGKFKGKGCDSEEGEGGGEVLASQAGHGQAER
jgi:hypothetical protein